MVIARRATPIISILLVSCSANEASETFVNDESVQVSASAVDLDDKDCIAQGLPASFVLTNNGDKPTRRVSWSFAAFKDNHSTDLAAGDSILSISDPSRMTDRIIQPGESFKVCSTMPRLQDDASPEDVSYQVTVDADFY